MIFTQKDLVDLEGCNQGKTLKDFISLIGLNSLSIYFLRIVVLFFPVNVLCHNQFLSLVGTIWPRKHVHRTL